MDNSWEFIYYAWFGKGDSSDDLEYETEVSDEEYAFLQKCDMYQNGDLDDDSEFDIKKYVEENKELVDSLTERVQREIEELEADNYDDDWDDEEDDEDDEDDEGNEMPTIVVRWPWE